MRPHPHIGLATVTYPVRRRDHAPRQPRHRGADPARRGQLDDGRARHRPFRAHRAATVASAGEPLHGLQCWVALPADDEESEPGFAHYGAAELPVVTGDGKTVRVVAGSCSGARSPVATLWDTLFADATLAAGATLPLDADYEERALYVVDGRDRRRRRSLREPGGCSSSGPATASR